MNGFRQQIETVLKQKRPNLSPGSLKTYVSILSNISKKIDPTNTSLDIFEKTEPILELLKEKPPASRKTSLSPLYVITGIEDYQRIMVADCHTVNEFNRQQVKTEKQTENWITMDEVKKLYDHFFKNTSLILANKQLLNYNVIVNYILLAFSGGVSGIPPRRSLDITEMKIRDYDEKVDNFYKNGVFHFNIFKTKQYYGTQTISVKEMSPEFYKILQKWIKINPTPYLIFTDQQNKFTSSLITRRFNNLFGKKHLLIT